MQKIRFTVQEFTFNARFRIGMYLLVIQKLHKITKAREWQIVCHLVFTFVFPIVLRKIPFGNGNELRHI